MRKLRIALSVLCLMLLTPLLLHAGRILPLDTRPLVAEKYAGWSGVLRLWVYEGWPCGSGSVAPWLNRCIARYEKTHPGVYIQPEYVDTEAIASVRDSGKLLPDMLLFPPGVLDSPTGLAILEPPAALRPELVHCGVWSDRIHAVPVVLGGYGWAWNTSMLDGPPGSWREANVLPAVPEPEIQRHWGAALLALCRGIRETSSGEEPSRQRAGFSDVDLGLNLPDEPEPTQTISLQTAPGMCRLPEGFAFDTNAWRHFAYGEAAALLVSQREVRRLQALSEQGREPDWRFSVPDGAFTDQLLAWGLVDKQDGEPQRALCLEFLNLLLSDECQGLLARIGAFGVTAAPSGFDAGDPLAQMDAALRSSELAAPNCFDRSWSDVADDIVRNYIAGTWDAEALWQVLAAKLAENPND